MIDTDRKHQITRLALAIRKLTKSDRATASRIAYFAEAIVGLTNSTDDHIEKNKAYFDAALAEATEINKRSNRK